MNTTTNHPSTSSQAREIPVGSLDAIKRYFRRDFVSGFFVFLIALPLCLGISMASGYPAMAGIFTAIIGSILCSFLSNSELTIKGPAAGLIVIVFGCVESFGGDGVIGGFSETDMMAYRSALAVGAVAAVFQILFGVFRAGILGEFFPRSVIHGMLAAIGVIIIAKQVPVALGVTAKGEPLKLLMQIPKFVMEANPAIAMIGVVSLVILFGWPSIRTKLGPLNVIPGQLVVLVVSILMGWALDLLHSSSYFLQGHEYQLGEQFLVEMPKKVLGMVDQVTYPNFSALSEPKAWYWIAMFFVVGTLESILSAKAVDTIDPWKRKTDMDRDVRAVGIANLAASLVGGLPMISEIVRSKANIDNGAKTRYAGMWHGVFLLVCVAFLPMVLHLIPKSALAAMLVYTGFRLAHPNEFVNILKIGREQLLIFVVTMIATLATDLLIGVGVGIGCKILIHLINRVPLKSLFKLYLDVEPIDETTVLIHAKESAVFSNWIPFRRQIEDLALVQGQNIVLDVSNTDLVDHTFQENLHELQHEVLAAGLSMEVIGLEDKIKTGGKESETSKSGTVKMRRISVIAEKSLEQRIADEMLSLGATGFTYSPCFGAGRPFDLSKGTLHAGQVRIETIVPVRVSDQIVRLLRRDFLPDGTVTATVETIDAILA
jgi:MFS superfamily sulfate permease-like transporter